MNPLLLSAPIRILPQQLADQIAAGEVIERPASVLKELLENALDAGATRIEIELKIGGMEAIRVTDNGHGIPGEELPLAISRHATSKIRQLDDLLRLHSLGFRGEALASICSVSQWEISSCQAGETSAFAMRYNQPQQVHEVNHATGTSVWIRKLFHNTPARRKFLRAERTEFRHCDDVFRRMALARFDVGFYLKHNGRQLQKLPAAADDTARARRVAQLCGQSFVQNSFYLDVTHSNMRLWGWISQPDYSRQQTDMQYFFINGRIIRDRVINHAMRQAYNAYLRPGRHAAYVLHFEIDPASVDVNVHPTKHEVRFREARMIHDFLSRCLRDSLRSGASDSVPFNQAVNESSLYYSTRDSSESLRHHDGQASAEHETFFGQVLTVLLGRYLLTQAGERLYLIDAGRARTRINLHHWEAAWEANDVTQRPVLIPERIALDTLQRQRYQQRRDLFQQLGFDIDQAGPGEIVLRAIPGWLSGSDVVALIHALLTAEIDPASPFDVIRAYLLDRPGDLGSIDIRHWLRGMEREREALRDCWRVLTQADLQYWLGQSAK